MININHIIANKIVPIIAGPTASGKTGLAIELAKIINGEIISSDSRQIYKLMDIGTAKPSQEELELVPHHLINILNPDESYSAGNFYSDTTGLISKIFAKNKVPIIAGGTGFYIRTLFEGLFSDDKDESLFKIRNELNQELVNFGTEHLYTKLVEVDPISASKYTDKNPRRVIRALEYYYHTGELFSSKQLEASNDLASEFNFKIFYINLDRNILYDRINQRVDQMISSGLLFELESLLSLGFDKSLNSLNTVGYKELVDYLDGIDSLDFAIDKIKQHTRNYAKRQITWFKKDRNKLDLGIDLESNLKIICNNLV